MKTSRPKPKPAGSLNVARINAPIAWSLSSALKAAKKNKKPAGRTSKPKPKAPVLANFKPISASREPGPATGVIEAMSIAPTSVSAPSLEPASQLLCNYAENAADVFSEWEKG